LQNSTEYNEQWQRAKHVALDLLSRREHSCLEIKRKLSRKHLELIDLDELCDELKSSGWLCHGRFAEAFIRSKRNKGQGPIKIAHELKQRGLTNDEYQNVLSEYDDWSELAEQCLNKKFNRTSANQLELQKMQRFLAQRGFGFDAIKPACDRYLKSKSDPD